MSKTLPLWWFLLLTNILTYPACGSSTTAIAGDFRTSKLQKQPKLMYGMIMESSKPGNQRTVSGFTVVQHTRTSQRPRAVRGGANNGGSSDILRRRNERGSANSISIKQPSLFRTVLGHLILGLLVARFC